MKTAHIFVSREAPEVADDTAIRPVPAAQAMELRERWRLYNKQQILEPGQFVKEKQGLGHFASDVVLMLWRMLDISDSLDRIMASQWMERIQHNRLDCVVAYVSDDGAGIMFEPHELAQLELAEGGNDD